MDKVKRETSADDQNLLKVARLEKGWSQAQLARGADLSEKTVNRAEKGLSISEVSKSRLARVFGKRIEDLFPSNGD